MIKFFRRIRYRLLNGNNFSKYLLYAIGEIILVVIGILIALQINNWNEDRKAQKAQRSLLINLYKNLKADSVVIQDNKENMFVIMEAQSQLHEFRKGKLVQSDINSPHMIRGSIRIYSITRANYPDVAPQIFNEAIKDEIREYYRLLASLDNAYTQYDNVVKQMIRPYMAENLLMNPDFLYENSNDINNAKQSRNFLNLDKFYEAVKSDYFGQILFESKLKASETIEFFDRILAANMELRNSIRNEIDK